MMKNRKNKKKLFNEEELKNDESRWSIIGKKLKNNYSNENFEFHDYLPNFMRKKVNEIKPIYNHISNLSINFNYIDLNDSRDIYHDFKKIMNDCDTEEISNKYNT